MIRLMETIFQTHCPKWDDIIQLLVSLFSTDERHRILTEARKWLREMVPEGTANRQQWAELATPDERLNWTVTQRKGGATWRDIRQLFYKVSRGGGPPKPVSMAKPSEMIQREQMNELKILYYIHTIYYYSAFKKKEILSYATIFMNHENIMWSEIN